jgi:ElaB/YqjD/DUF883 family membrane-anchored ribosome-binding protein
MVRESEIAEPQEVQMSERLEDKKINEALELLNELAKEKKAELLGMVTEKYSSLKSALNGTAGKLEEQARETLAQGEAKAREIASKVDDDVHKNPWPYLAGTALGFLVLGLFFGRSRK